MTDASARDAQARARYRRQIALDGFGEERQRALLGAHVLVVGAGGLGSPAILYLAGAGVGRITIVDPDTVEISNLHRQVIHTTARRGMSKAESARRAALDLNPTIEVAAVAESFTNATAARMAAEVDVIVDGSDNFETRHACSAAAAAAGIPHVWAAILGFDAQLSVFWQGHGPIYEDLYAAPPAPGSVPNCAQAGVIGPLVGVVGAAMALETVKLLTGLGRPLIGQVGVFSSLEGTWEYVPLLGKPDTTPWRPAVTRPPTPEVDEIPEGARLIDVRTPAEHAAAAIPGDRNVPLSDDFDLPPHPGVTVLYCARGSRSARAWEMLQERGHAAGVVSLRGGIEAWLDRQA